MSPELIWGPMTCAFLLGPLPLAVGVALLPRLDSAQGPQISRLRDRLGIALIRTLWKTRLLLAAAAFVWADCLTALSGHNDAWAAVLVVWCAQTSGTAAVVALTARRHLTPAIRRDQTGEHNRGASGGRRTPATATTNHP